MIKTFLKISFAALIIGWLFNKGLIDFSIVPKSLEFKLQWAVCLLFIILNLLLTSYRWKLLVEIKSEKNLSFFEVFKLSWIGVFFSSVLPGVVTGDLVKLVYARSLDEKLSKTFLLTSIFMDRVIGLIGLLTLLGIFTILNYSELVALSSTMNKVVHFNFILFGFVLLFISTLFIPAKAQDFFINELKKFPVIGNKLSNLFAQIWLIGNAKKIFFIALFMSTCSQSLNVFAFWFIGSPFFDVPVSLAHAFTFIPIGLTSLAIPLTPAGLGVGHAAFGELFSYFGVTTGASIFNLFFLASLSINLLGVIPYLLAGKKIKKIDENF